MSSRNYGGGESQRSNRHQQYDPYAESDRYGGSQGQVRRVNYERDDSGRSDLYGGTRSYGGGGSSSMPASSRQQGYSETRSGPSVFSGYHEYEPARARELGGFPSGIQQADVWKASNASNQRSQRQTVNYTPRPGGEDRDSYRPTWGGLQASSNISQSGRRQEQTVSFNYKGSLGMASPTPTQAHQPVLMMVPPGSSNLMGLVANPFTVQRQGGAVPMIVGSLPGTLNPNIFDQQMMRSGGGGSYGGTQSRQNNVGRSSGRSDGGGSSMSSFRRGGSVTSSSRGRRSPPAPVFRRNSPSGPRHVRRNNNSNAVYRKPININPPNAMSRKRPVNRPEFGDQKKIKTNTGVAVVATPPNASPNRKPSGSQRRKEKRQEDADAKKAAPTTGTPKKFTPVSSPGNKGEKKSEGDKTDHDKSITPIQSAVLEGSAVVVTSMGKMEVEVVVIEDDSVTSKGEEEKKPKSKYDSFPTSLLVCKVCQKCMKDGGSYESHLSGRAHTALVKIVEARFQKRAEMLMLESKLDEEEIAVELDRQKRAGKITGNAGKLSNHCKMCDCAYTVNWGTHKISLGHRILKEFLHPSCRACNANFMHRMDWLNHLFSLGHLSRIAEQRNAGRDTTTHESPTQEELFTIILDLKPDEKPSNLITIRNSDWKVPSEVDETEKSKEVDETEKPIEVDETEKPKEVDETEKSKEVEETEKPKEVDETEKTNEVDGTEKSNEVDETEKPTEVDETEKPKEADETDKAKEVEETEKPTEVDGTEKPKEVDETEKPKEVDETEKAKEVEETEKSNEVDETEKTNEVDETEKTNAVDETEKTNEVDGTEKTNEVDGTEKTNEVDGTEKSNEVDETEKTNEVDENQKASEAEAEAVV